MSDNKRYYYMRLKEDYFDSEEMIILESMQDGYLYSNILLKLYLRSLKSQGRLMYKGFIPYSPEVLAQITRHSVGTIEKALRTFATLGLVEILDSGVIYMLDIQNFIGESSTEADRKRLYRAKIDDEKRKSISSAMDKCPDKSEKCDTKTDKCPDKSPPEIDLEIDLDIDHICAKTPALLANCDINCDTKCDIDDFFEKLWKLYPRKKDKSKVSKSQRLKLFKIGEEHMKRAIARYVKENVDINFMEYGNRFFNSAYLDYLDENYEPLPDKKTIDVPQHINFEQREVDSSYYKNLENKLASQLVEEE